jgi:hypothetical protein
MNHKELSGTRNRQNLSPLSNRIFLAQDTVVESRQKDGQNRLVRMGLTISLILICNIFGRNDIAKNSEPIIISLSAGLNRHPLGGHVMDESMVGQWRSGKSRRSGN